MSGPGRLQISFVDMASLDAIGRLVNAVPSAFHHRARLANTSCFNVVRRLFGKFASSRCQIPEHGASRHRSSSRRRGLVPVDSEGQEIMYQRSWS